MVSLILPGRKFFSLDKAKTALDALFLTTLRWWFQLRFSSKWTPTNLKDSFLHPVPTLSISLLSILKFSVKTYNTYDNVHKMIFDYFSIHRTKTGNPLFYQQSQAEKVGYHLYIFKYLYICTFCTFVHLYLACLSDNPNVCRNIKYKKVLIRQMGAVNPVFLYLYFGIVTNFLNDSLIDIY